MDEASIFLEALQKPTPADRAAYLDAACAGDAELRRSVEMLLKAHSKAGDFLNKTPPNAGPTTDQSLAERPGTIIGPYKLLQQIGEGGMGTVYMAEQTQPVQRKVALKLIKAGMDSRQVIARFEAERQALAMMDHVNIARVFDGGATDNGRPYFVMELVHGVPITKYCDDNQLTPRQRLELFVPVCQAIQHAHQKGIIHRDIKPSNVMITLYDGKPVPKVIDFGVAKATEQKLTELTLFTQYGTMVGTLEYMSPEQAEMSALGVDTRSDIYSLGVLLYELLTGSTPLTHKRIKEAAYAEILRMIKEEEPPRPSTRLSDSGEALASISAQRHMEPSKLTKLVRGELDWIVMKTLEKDRNRRYETAKDFAADVQRYLNDETVQACPPSAWYRFRKFARRNKAAMTMVAMFSVAVLIAVAALSVSTVLTSRAYAAEKKARLQSEANLELTRKAIDEFFTKVSQSKLLDVPGLQPLRKDLLESAVKFQLSLAAERPDDLTVRADLAAAHLRLAVLYFEVDRNDDCQASLNAGLEVMEQLRREYPENRELYRRVAGYFKAHRPMSGATSIPKDIAGSTQLLQKFATLWEQLAAEDPETLAFRLDLAAVYGFRADFFGQTQGREKGAADCRRSIALLEDLLRAKPDEPEYQALLALAHTQLAWQLGFMGQKEELIAANAKALQLRERLVAKHGDVPQYRKDFLSSLSWKSTRLREQGKVKEAELLRQRIAREQVKLADEYPNVAAYRIGLAVALKNLAAIAAKSGHNADAEELLRRALDIRVKLIVDDRQNADTGGLNNFTSEIAGLQRSLGRLEEADGTFGRVYELLERQAAKYSTGERKKYGYRWELGYMGRSYAFHLRGTGRPKEAIRTLKKAAEAFAKLVAEEPSWREAWDVLADTLRELANTYIAIHKPADAEALMRQTIAANEKLAALNPKEPEPRDRLARNHYDLAGVLQEIGQKKKAVQSFRDAIAMWEKLAADYRTKREYRDHLAWGHGKLADVLDSDGQPQEALKARRETLVYVEGLVVEFPATTEYQVSLVHNTNALVEMLKKARQDRDVEKARRRAVTFYEKLAAANPSERGLRDGLARSHYDLAGLFAQQKQPEEAIKEFREAIAGWEKLAADFRDSPEFRQHLAWTFGFLAGVLNESKQPAEAENALGKAVTLFGQLGAEFPTAGDYRQWQGHHLWKLGAARAARSQTQDAEKAYRQAAAVFEKLAREFPKAPFFRQEIAFTYYVYLGPLLEKTQQPQEAELAYRKAVTIHEKLVTETGNAEFAARLRTSYDRLVALLKANGKTRDADKVRRQALEFYEKRATAKPKMTEYRQEIGQLHIQFGEWDNAAAAYTKVIELKPDDWNAWYKRGWLKSNMQQWDKAIADYSEAIKLKPNVWDAWFGRGFAHGGLLQWDKAIADYSEAIRLAPDVHAPLAYRAGVYAHLRQWDRSVADLSKLLEKYPNDSNAWYWRGIAYGNLKQPEKAIADLRQAIDRGFSDVQHMKTDPVLEPLRSREDFKKLLAELEAKKKG